MNNKIFITVFILVAIVLQASAEELPESITVGQDINQSLTIMSGLGDGEPLLAMETGSPDYAMKMWATDDGVIIAVYEVAGLRISSLIFWISDERPKGTRKTFSFDIKMFTPTTGEMSMVVPNKAIQKGRADARP